MKTKKIEIKTNLLNPKTFIDDKLPVTPPPMTFIVKC